VHLYIVNSNENRISVARPISRKSMCDDDMCDSAGIAQLVVGKRVVTWAYSVQRQPYP